MFKKGQSGNPSGRKPGTKNRLPRDLVERILAIEEDLTAKGKGLKACAKQDPQWFLEQFVKPLIPKNVDITGTLETKVSLSEALIEKLDEIYATARRS